MQRRPVIARGPHQRIKEERLGNLQQQQQQQQQQQNTASSNDQK